MQASQRNAWCICSVSFCLLSSINSSHTILYKLFTHNLSACACHHAELSPIPAAPVFEAAHPAPEETLARTDSASKQLQLPTHGADEPHTITATNDAELSTAEAAISDADIEAAQAAASGEAEASSSEAEAAASESEDEEGLLAQLSESMWATLRPQQQQSQELHSQPSTSGRATAGKQTSSLPGARLMQSLQDQLDAGMLRS